MITFWLLAVLCVLCLILGFKAYECKDSPSPSGGLVGFSILAFVHCGVTAAYLRNLKCVL